MLCMYIVRYTALCICHAVHIGNGVSPIAWYAGMISNLTRIIGLRSLISPVHQCTIVPMRINVRSCTRPSAYRLLILYNNLFFFLFFPFLFFSSLIRKSFVPFQDCTNDRWTIPAASCSIYYSSHCSDYELCWLLVPSANFPYLVSDRASALSMRIYYHIPRKLVPGNSDDYH